LSLAGTEDNQVGVVEVEAINLVDLQPPVVGIVRSYKDGGVEWIVGL